jgi:hypothetical protein
MAHKGTATYTVHSLAVIYCTYTYEDMDRWKEKVPEDLFYALPVQTPKHTCIWLYCTVYKGSPGPVQMMMQYVL